MAFLPAIVAVRAEIQKLAYLTVPDRAILAKRALPF
jgi:hypothetical protein